MRPGATSLQVCVPLSEYGQESPDRASGAGFPGPGLMTRVRSAAPSPARTRFRSWFWLRLGLGIALIPALAGAPAHPAIAQSIEASPESALKAAFLYNFARFVSWPDTTWAHPDDPFVFGLLGADPLTMALVESIKEREVQGRPLTVRRVSGAADLVGCHVVFVGNADRRMLSLVMETAGRQPILTVGESRDFARQGGMITFILKGNKLGFEINRPAADLAGLRISSKLLKLATVAPE
jgi:hypothetical protein